MSKMIDCPGCEHVRRKGGAHPDYPICFDGKIEDRRAPDPLLEEAREVIEYLMSGKQLQITMQVAEAEQWLKKLEARDE